MFSKYCIDILQYIGMFLFFCLVLAELWIFMVAA